MGSQLFELLPRDVVLIVLRMLPIETRVRLRVPPNKAVIPPEVLRCFESPIRVNETGAHVRDGVLAARWGCLYMGMFFQGADLMVRIGTLDNHPEYTTLKRIDRPATRGFMVEHVIEACDGGKFDDDHEFVDDLRSRLQGWLRR
jgi:hypothetical protein